MPLKLPKPDKTMPLVQGTITINGKPTPFDAVATPQYQRFIQTSSIRIETPGGGSAFSGETAADPYDPAQMQRVINALAAIYGA